MKNSSSPTFPVIIGNIDKILSRLKDTRLSIRVNINKKNYMDFVEVHNYLRQKYPNNKKLNVYPGIIREETPDNMSLCSTSFTPSEILELHELLRKEGLNTSDFPQKTDRGCMMYQQTSFIIGPNGEIYKCWNDVTNEKAIIGNINEHELTNSSLYIKYSAQSIPFNDECKHCFAFPICDGGCGYHRYRNMFENCNFNMCSPYKDVEKLKKALLSGLLPK